jgi:hypothetical protein
MSCTMEANGHDTRAGTRSFDARGGPLDEVAKPQ